MSRDALVVGINTYGWGGLENLQSPAEDAEAIAQRLEQYGDFRVRRLPDFHDPFNNNDRRVAWHQDMTVEQLEKALVQMFKPTGKHIPSTALFFFSGHGLRKDRGVQEGYLATSDTNPDQGNWGLSLQWLRRLLEDSPVQEQIVWLDCCYSGEALNFREAEPGRQNDNKSLFLLAASREFEAAYTDISSEHSILTTALLEGLDPNRQSSGVVTNDSLIEGIRQRLKRDIQQPLWINPSREILLTGQRQEQITPNVEGICPYRGLRPFNEDYASYFYGREQLTNQLLRQVQVGYGNFVAVLGASGSGKSSVIHAGLIYQLKQGDKQSGTDQWQILTLTPQENPLDSLAAAFLDQAASNLDRADQLQKAEAAIAEGSSGLARLIRASQAPRTVLLIDQFEEVFTLCQNLTKRQQFFACLLGALEQADDKLCLVIAMRADFMGKCTEQDYGGLAKQIQQHLILVEPMKAEELERAIQEPAKQVGLRVDANLVTQILTDLSIEEISMPHDTNTIIPIWEPGSLPLLEYILEQLWQYRTLDRLTLDNYIRLGGVKKALENRADQVYQSFTPDEQQVAKHIFLALTHLGEGTEDTRRRIFKQDLVNTHQPEVLVDRVIQTLAAERLIVTSQVEVKGLSPRRVEEVVDIAHEALIRHWRRLRQWVSGNREAIRIARKIEAAAQEWKYRNQPEEVAYLLQGARLAEAELFLKEYGNLNLLSVLAQEFIEASQRVNARLEQIEKNRKRQQVGGVVAFFSIIAIAAAVFGVQQQRARQTLEAVFLSSNPAQVTQALPKFFETAQQLESNPSKENVRLALSYYREIVAVTNKLLKDNPGSFETALKQGRDRAEDRLATLIAEHRIAELKRYLTVKKFGELISGKEFTTFEKQFTEGALQTTYKLLMRDFGAGADRNNDGQLSENEAELLPCDTLTTIEKLWQKAKKSCSWDDEICIEIPIDATHVASQSLATSVFDYVGVSYAMERVQNCRKNMN